MSLCFARCEFDCGVTLIQANYWIISVEGCTNPSQSLINHFEDAKPLFRHIIPHSPVHARSRADFTKRESQRPNSLNVSLSAPIFAQRRGTVS